MGTQKQPRVNPEETDVSELNEQLISAIDLVDHGSLASEDVAQETHPTVDIRGAASPHTPNLGDMLDACVTTGYRCPLSYCSFD